MAGKCAQLFRGFRAASRFTEQTLAERQRLIRADDEAAGVTLRHRKRLLPRQQRSDSVGRCKP